MVKKDNKKCKCGAKEKCISFGVPGMDKIFKCGIRKNSSVLLSGDPGAGKSIAALQFIYQGAKEGQPGLYITSEESAQSLQTYCDELGLKDIGKYIKTGLITIVEEKVTEGKIISLEAPMQLLQKKKIERVVIDSLTLFEYIYSTEIDEFRRGVIRFLSVMKEAGVTLIATSDRYSTDLDEVEFKPEDFLFEGLVLLTKIRKGASYERILTVTKMRGQDHRLGIFPLTISNKGMEVHVNEVPYALIEQDMTKSQR